MTARTSVIVIRLLPVVFVAAAAMFYIVSVEGWQYYVWRNLLPVMIAVVLAGVTLWKGDGRWTGGGWRWLLGSVGFALPAIGLSLYLHWGYSVDLNGMFSESVYPQELFRFLPLYTIVAGTIGFAIGWIAGRNV